MLIKYLYYDDALAEEAEPYVRVVETANPDLKIDLETPKPYDSQIDHLSNLTDGNYDGVILDLRLDQTANEVNGGGKKRANYRATTLAQELRTRGTEREIDELPVVMWSMESKLKESYLPDETGHDLFDLASSKEELATEDGAREMARRLVALADGYREIRRLKSQGKSKTYHYLGFNEEPDFLDERVASLFDDRRRAPAHEYARFIIHSLFEKPGVLIAEDILAARLGIDVEESSDWDKLISEVLEKARYDGPFAEGWPRWWAFLVESWWRNSKPPKSLRGAIARERVEHLKDLTGLSKLVPAEAICPQYSTRYWTICLGFEHPLDPVDGLEAKDDDLKGWHDPPYLSKKAALEKKGESKGLRVSPLEKAKLARLKEEFEKANS
jgi:hypothetical protein